jgi:hypothetical protein
MVAGALKAAHQEWCHREQHHCRLSGPEIGDRGEGQHQDETSYRRRSVDLCVSRVPSRSPPGALLDAEQSRFVRSDSGRVDPVVVVERFAAIPEREIVDDALLNGLPAEDAVPRVAPTLPLPEREVELFLDGDRRATMLLVVAQ